ncbi:MAG: hydroxylamine reductase [Armatimonadetes bacterium]|nr:hydroxylamine reductase [Armatimonadota bacterium]
MFCFQCEQAAGGAGCASFGVCGKDPVTANVQNVLVEVTKGLACYATRARQYGLVDHDCDVAVLEALFTTVTNVNFDAASVADRVRAVVALRERVRRLYEAACQATGVTPEVLAGSAAFQPADTLEGLAEQGEQLAVPERLETTNADIVSLQELLLYGVKGMAAYADHAMILGQEDDAVYAFCHEALALLSREASADELLAACLRCGEVNLRAMELLDAANTGAYGHPVPTPVRITPVAGKCILVSGHDLRDLAVLLEQTAGLGINIYTHGEMLPAHGYPELKKHAHLVGNYSGAWQDQCEEFAQFPGAVLMTTNCLQEPQQSYDERLFTCGLVAWPGIPHIADRDFRPVIAAALAAPGFAADEPERSITVGFAHQTVLSVADQLLEAVGQGAVRHVFLVGGCNGAKSGRNYFTDLVEQTPSDTLVLTLGCGKYRFNKLELGDIGGIPRLLDMGQCNDAYSAIQVAVALAQALETDVNSLPLSLVLSWYEQKAVAVLLTLLHLGVMNIRIGPSLPAFVSPNILRALVTKFGLAPITTPENDLALMLS